MGENAVSIHSGDEVADAIRVFTPADWARLKLVSVKYAGLARWSAEDLLQEAVGRALGGGRNCKTTVDVVRFLAEAMRSIAHGEGEKMENQVSKVPIKGGTLNDDHAVEPPDLGFGAEQALAAEQDAAAKRSAVLALFSDDQMAHDIVDGLWEGLVAGEIREVLGLDETAYASKRRYIRRTVDKNFPEGLNR